MDWLHYWLRRMFDRSDEKDLLIASLRRQLRAMRQVLRELSRER
ncbi:MAG: hypothetical protein ACE5JX_19220 [Acidobacteriota bacterium]